MCESNVCVGGEVCVQCSLICRETGLSGLHPCSFIVCVCGSEVCVCGSEVCVCGSEVCVHS